VLVVYFRRTINFASVRNRDENRKLQISTSPTKAKSREPAYSQALNQIKIDRQRAVSGGLGG